MESNFSNRDFEQFVKQNADQYRMFPSEKVWKGVHNALHTRRRWYGVGLAFLLLLTGGAVTLVMKSYPVSKKQGISSNLPSQLTSAAETKSPSNVSTDIEELLPFDGQHPAESPEYRPYQPLSENSLTSSDQPPTATSAQVLASISFPAVHHITFPETEQLHPTISNRIIASQALPLQREESAPQSFTTPQDKKPAAVAVLANDRLQFTPHPYQLLTIESVTNQYKAAKKRLSWQIFITPTISYRKLGENKSFSGSNGVYPFASLSDVNNAVTHKPDLGMQIGFSARYPVTKSLKVLAGLQFNINRYDIKAFAYPGEVAVINLDDANNNSVSTWTYYRSQSGYKSDWLKNFYFSVSLPIGAELQLFGNKKTSFGIAGTIQPTYIIKDRAYLISTDYKNYAEVPWLVRRMNVSTGFEAFVNYTKGKNRWQIGPQVRYQLLSSFQNKYPVKENLFDFGVKVGLTLNQK